MNIMKKAILYLRFSDTKQIGNTSIETQEQVCRNTCLAEGFEVVGVVKNEAVSASKTNTQRVIELLDFCKQKQGKFDVLMVFKLDRFARSQEQHHWLRGQLMKIGIILRSATERIDESPSGRLVEGVLAAVNEYDNEIKRERVKLSMWKRVEQGLWPWIPPTGYKTNRAEGVKLSPNIFDESCCEAVKEIFSRYSSGLYTKSELAKEYTKKRIKDYKERTIKFSKQTIDHILNNQFYIGLLKNNDGIYIKGLHEPLIEVSLFEQCQVIQSGLSNHTTRKRLYNHPDFPLRRFVLCGMCRKPLTGCWAKSGKYPYYYCLNKGCAKFSQMIRKSDLENEFVDYMKNIKPSGKVVSRFRSVFIKRYEERQQEIKGDYSRQMENIQKLEREEAWIIEKAKKGVLPDHLVKEQISELEKKITVAKMELTEKHGEELDVDALLSYAESFIRTVDNAWFDAPSEVKIRLQRAIFPEGVSYHYPGYSNSKISPIFEVIRSFATQKYESVTPLGLEPRFLG